MVFSEKTQKAMTLGILLLLLVRFGYWGDNSLIWSVYILILLLWNTLRVLESTNFSLSNRCMRVACFLGFACNATAVLVNGGHMPSTESRHIEQLWQPITQSTKLIFLCDVHHGFSFGDITIGLGIVVGLAVWAIPKLWRKSVTIPNQQEVA